MNLKKHRVGFDEAQSVFYDDLARIFEDVDHSFKEERFLIFGFSNKNRQIIVSFTERDDKVRLISARRATNNERKSYEDYRK